MTTLRRAGIGTTSVGMGIVLYLIGVFLFALNDALGKWLVADYSVGQLLLLRSVGAAIILVPMVWHLKVDLFDFGQWRLQVVRILCMAGDTFCFYFATRSMPLADVMTFYMAAPLIITALSVPLLGERVEPFRWGAVIVGFIGVLVALQPSAELFSSASPIALVGAIMFGLAVTVTRRLRRTHWLPLVVWQFAGAGVIGAATIPFAWATPGWFDLVLMFLVGIVAMVCFVCITRALAMAPAAMLAPFQYSAMVWATLMGWIVWRDVPTLPILIGNCIIIGSGLFVFYRDRATVSAPAE
ncbi:DMT family transporter [Labrys sp. 22185]|uniref:DMT family transporter n=1 Tax=Labrys sp. 22185 TaxID=3453888 RepID=UPI003F859887